MLYRLICPVLGFLKRHPSLAPLSLLALLVLAFGSILYAKIYQNWDRDPDRGALAIEAGAYPEWELGVQVFTQEQAENFSFDVLDATKIVPEEMVPVQRCPWHAKERGRTL